MPEPAKNQDIEFQPPVQGYSYSSSNPIPKSQTTVNPVLENPSSKKKSGKILNTIFTLIFFILGVFLLFLIFLGILNYLNILPFSAAYPNQLGWLPHRTSSTQQEKSAQTDTATPVFSPQRNSWMAKGTLYRYNDNQIEIKVGEKIIKLEFSSANSMFYKSVTLLLGSNSITNAATTNPIPYTLYDLDQKENLGKKMEVYYTTDTTGKNTIQTITLLN